MAQLVSEEALMVDVFCWDNSLYNGSRKALSSNPILRLLFSIFTNKAGSVFMRIDRRLFKARLRKIIINSLIQNHDLIDFHAYSTIYIPFMLYCNERDIHFDITLWGSDIMRADERGIAEKRIGFEKCRFIKATENLQSIVSEKYQGVFDDKLKTVYWGNNDFEAIDKVRGAIQNVETIRQSLLPKVGNKTVVTIGYNGSRAQNHLRILETIEKLPRPLLDSVFIILPMTYGAPEGYIDYVEKAVQKLGVSYVIYGERLPVETIAKIRLVSDVVVNMQDTDAFSGSLQGHLYCGNVLIIAEWLHYVPLDRTGVFYLKSSFETLEEKVTEVIQNMELYRARCANNSRLMRELTSWEAVTKTWSELYKIDQ